MPTFEFMNFTATPEEKHFGIATVKYNGKIILRYKLLRNKEGSGFYPMPASYKIKDVDGDKYVSAFTLDSMSEKEELEALIKRNVTKLLTAPSVSSLPLRTEPEANFPF